MQVASILPKATDFACSTDVAWRALVDKVLKGASFAKLVGKTADGMDIQPLYGPATGLLPRALRSRAGRWAITQIVEHPDASQANALALADLEGGADALALVFAGSTGDHGFGLSAAATLADVLAGVDIDLISLRLDAPGDGVAPAKALARLIALRRLVPSRQSIDFGCDPLGATVKSGGDVMLGPALDLAKDLNDQGFSGHVLMADGRCVHNLGGSEVQELAYVLASGLCYLRALEHRGFSLDEARQQISFLMAADADQFLTIAKFRALRLLWARIEEACGLEPRPITLHAQTAWRMLTRRDPYVNVLRTTMAVFGAGIGGADSITALPFTTALGLPDAAARRIARNSQLILTDEAHLADVDDPAAGAGGMEALTHGLCQTAWGQFQAIERLGGIEASFDEGSFWRSIKASAQVRARAIATRSTPLTGTSQYPDLTEGAVEVLIATPVQQGKNKQFQRDASPFEEFRDAAALYAARNGGRNPKIFLANLGPAADFAARASFAANAFASGGIEAIGNAGFARADGTTDALALMEAARESGAEMACICGSDASCAAEIYNFFGPLQGQFQTVFLVGRPIRESPPGLCYVFAGCDVLGALARAHAGLAGVKS